jgi:ribosome-associated protein
VSASPAASQSTSSFQRPWRGRSSDRVCTAGRQAKLRSVETRKDPFRLTSLEQARLIAGLAQEKLAEEVVILDLRPVCAYTDFFVLCSGRNPRQTKAIVDEVRERLKQEHGMRPRSVEGQGQGDWIVVDYLDVVLHVFTPETRGYYGLEELWGDMPSVELDAATA